MSDNVNHPKHYNAGKIEVIEFLEDQQLEPHEWNAVKYICRAKLKGRRIEDLEKAIWYLKRKIELLKAEREGREPLRPNAMATKEEKPPVFGAASTESGRIPFGNSGAHIAAEKAGELMDYPEGRNFKPDPDKPFGLTTRSESDEAFLKSMEAAPALPVEPKRESEESEESEESVPFLPGQRIAARVQSDTPFFPAHVRKPIRDKAGNWLLDIKDEVGLKYIVPASLCRAERKK